MLKARNKKLSMLLVLAMLMTMFVGVGTASAAIVDYSAYGVVTVNTQNSFNKDLGTILIEIDQARYLNNTQNWVTLKMPSGTKIQDGPGTVKEAVTAKSVQIKSVSGSVYGDYTGTSGVEVFFKNDSTVDLLVDGAAFTTADEEIKIELSFTEVKVQSGSGNLDVMFIPQGGSVLPGGTVTIANIVSKGATQALVSSVKSVSDGVHDIDTINIGELSPGVFKDAGTKKGRIEIELPAGVKWNLRNTMPGVGDVPVAGAWDFTGKGPISGPLGSVLNPASAKTSTVDSRIVKLSTNNNEDILYVEFVNNLTASKAGRIDIGGNGFYLSIDIDEDDAKKGEIKAKISAKNIDGVTKQDLVIAKYGDFETTVNENKVTELIAGQDEQELGSFYIEETLKGSLVGNRTIVLELPSGVKWNKAPDLTAEKGEINYDEEDNIVTDKKVRYTLSDFSDTAGKILVEEGEVYVEPGFSGDVEIEVSGTAGAKGTVKVAEVVKAVEVTASKVPNVIIGEQNVAAGDIIIKENVAEAIQEGDIVIELAGGYVFYKEPTVKVTEGDLRIDDVDINNDDQLVITIDKESNDASTITISDVYVTGYRYAPTGPVVAKIVAAKGNKDKGDYTGSTALDTLYIAPDKAKKYSDDDNKVDREKNTKYSEKSVGEVTIANCITPAEGAGIAEFKVGSNIYYVGGNAKVMDVAPYIKGDRTFVPMRYVAEMLGAEVVWDDAARTVTLTKGDDVVVFTIGSASYTVNGEAMTADVAPEIANERTMLPARYVAEAFGAVVGWDAGTQTVIIQQ